MPSIPLPFVVVILLLVLFTVLLKRHDKSYYPALAFILCSALTISLVGARWTTEWSWVRSIQPIVASLVPPLTWWCYSHAMSNKSHWRLIHVAVVALVSIGISQFDEMRDFIDFYIIGTYVGYAIALFKLTQLSPDEWKGVKFSQVDAFKTSLYFTSGLLLFSAVVDVGIVLDFALSEGKNITTILSVGHILILPVLAYAVSIAGGTISLESNSEPVKKKEEVTQEASTTDSEEDTHIQVLDTVENLLLASQLHLDPNLNLNRLARKSGIPARNISIAVNTLKGKNVSQFINEYRIQNAMNLLETSNHSITDIYEMVGFHSKSNFNREFSRITDSTPSKYRQMNRSKE
ncbi:helix-turn-helix domain-containing protein [Vibrio penaeicida]|uniref:helix-turn-helix domain-containing protein n=1 Tax=Vibrio penaeicida TaxID=104609 RepID=UPI001F384EFC|nr:AraC family transcriptional regulator [Vibrio penaeicida]